MIVTSWEHPTPLNIKKCLLVLAFLAAWTALLSPRAQAFELEEGVNNAGVISFPTALNQISTHLISANIEITDIKEPDLNLANLRYGLQLGAFQLLTDANYVLEPEHEFDYLEVKGKLQVLGMEEYRSYLALGFLVRGVEKAEEREARIDDRTTSLFAISTFEVFPFETWGGVLINVYLDNRFGVLGMKLQIYQSVQVVAEAERLHSTEREEPNHIRAGVSFEGVQNTYVQLLWSDVGDNILMQIGTGF